MKMMQIYKQTSKQVTQKEDCDANKKSSARYKKTYT